MTRARRWGAGLALTWLLLLLAVALTVPYLPLAFSPDTVDLTNIAMPPQVSQFSHPGHLLGTDPYGRDVLTALLYGTRTALLVSLPAALLAALAGISSGSSAGFWGNSGLRVKTGWLVAAGAAVLFTLAALPCYWGSYRMLYLLAIPTGFFMVGGILLQVKRLSAPVPIPLDSLLQACITLVSSIPRLVLVLALAAVVEPSLPTLVLVLALSSWVGTARLVRAEVARVRQLPYLEAARAAGIPELRLLVRHVLPNALRPVKTSFPLSIAGLIGLETTLSFLGVGLPPEVPSWGRTLALVRLTPTAWWLVVFPVLLILLTTLALQQLASRPRG
ncbi:ABC transporter permease [Hymenobacter sp. BT175]|uniref:ABC transporter permease n=1 Tax=Hymenobacter translucens TaxID=2886507 RepID=UPI001D0E0507|nr:ABC transporter permease [Hymenobacter translucens]MCC2546831.1 ABC transporter permease [Hymenobacter translucens]